MKRLLSFLTLTLALLALTPGLAAAHAEIEKSSPAVGAKIGRANAPTKLTLNLSEEIAREGNTVSVTANGTNYATGAPVVDFDNPKLVTVNLNPLQAGTYTVKWRTITAEDNGPSEGTFTFTITDDSAPAGTNTASATETPNPSAATPTSNTPVSSNTALPPTGNTAGRWDAALILLGAPLLVLLGLALRRLVRA